MLARIMRERRDAPVQRFGAKVDAHAFDATVPWPPLLHVSGLPEKLNSSGLLLQSFGKQGVKDAHPIYVGHFTRQAVLVFEKDHSGWERAKAFLDTCGMERDEVVRLRGEGKTEEAAAKEKALIKSEWVQEHMYNGRWKNEKWAKKKLFRTVVVFRRKNELEQEVAEAKRMQKEEQERLLLRSVQEAEKLKEQLTAQKEEEAAKAKQAEEELAERKASEEQERQKVAALDAQLAELQEEREVSRRQQEEQRAKQVEKDKELDEVRAAQRVAEERLRRLEEDLRVKSREAREAEENLDLVCASLNQKEAALKESGASSETARQEEEIRELKSFQAKLEQDKREAEDKAAEAKKAAAAAKTAAENQSSVEKSTLEGMASEMQLLEDGVSFADKELRRGDNPERLERTGKFVDRKVGELDLDVLKKCGMKLKMTDYDAQGNPVHLDLWVANWQCAISGAEPAYYDLPSTYPAFKPSDAFRSFQGKFVTVREEDEVIPGRSLRMPGLGGRAVQTPDTVCSAAFVKDIRRRYPKGADRILRHIMTTCNLIRDCKAASGYSIPRVLWDTERDAPMRLEDKIRYLIEFSRAGGSA